MTKLLALALSLPLFACEVGEGTGGSTGAGGGVMGDHLTSNTTWTGAMSISSTTVVDPGVTLTIAAGTAVAFAPSGLIDVRGVVDVQGTKAAPVQLSPSAPGGHHGGFWVAAGGELKMSYGVQVGGGILVDGGKITVADTRMSQTQGDFLVVGAGTVDVSYSAIGLEPGAGTDTTHCDLHFGGSGTTIRVTHSNISTSSYGLMLYGGNGVDLTYNNWFANPIQIDTSPGVSGDISFGWFDKGAPSAGAGATLTYTSPAAARLTDAGPR